MEKRIRKNNKGNRGDEKRDKGWKRKDERGKVVEQLKTN